MATPFLPAAMKYSTSSSSECSVTSAAGLRGLRASFGSAASLVASSTGAPPIAVPSVAAPARRRRRRVGAVETMISPVERRDVAVVGEQRAVFAGGDEVDADRVLPRIAARAILDVQQVAVVLLVALHRDRARRRRQRLRQRRRACPCRRSTRGRRRRRRSASTISRGWPRRSTICSSFWCAIILLQQLLELGAGDLACSSPGSARRALRPRA